jgi:hypothetical protein
MARKGWTALSPGYRARLEKNGISKTAYEAGESIKEARGHKATPERPAQGKQFPQYQQERDRLVRTITAKKQHWFGTSPKWNPDRANAKFRKDPPPMIRLRQWAKMTQEEWLDAIRSDDTAAAYLGYH